MRRLRSHLIGAAFEHDGRDSVVTTLVARETFEGRQPHPRASVGRKPALRASAVAGGASLVAVRRGRGVPRRCRVRVRRAVRAQWYCLRRGLGPRQIALSAGANPNEAWGSGTTFSRWSTRHQSISMTPLSISRWLCWTRERQSTLETKRALGLAPRSQTTPPCPSTSS